MLARLERLKMESFLPSVVPAHDALVKLQRAVRHWIVQRRRRALPNPGKGVDMEALAHVAVPDSRRRRRRNRRRRDCLSRKDCFPFSHNACDPGTPPLKLSSADSGDLLRKIWATIRNVKRAGRAACAVASTFTAPISSRAFWLFSMFVSVGSAPVPELSSSPHSDPIDGAFELRQRTPGSSDVFPLSFKPSLPSLQCFHIAAVVLTTWLAFAWFGAMAVDGRITSYGWLQKSPLHTIFRRAQTSPPRHSSENAASCSCSHCNPFATACPPLRLSPRPPQHPLRHHPPWWLRRRM